MNESSLIMAALAVLLAWAAFALHRLRRALHRERAENRRLRELIRTGSREADAELERARRLRHDLRQHYRLMQRSLEQGDYAQLSNYLEAYAGEIPDGPGGSGLRLTGEAAGRSPAWSAITRPRRRPRASRRISSWNTPLSRRRCSPMCAWF